LLLKSQPPIEIEKRVVGQTKKGGVSTITLNFILHSRQARVQMISHW